MSSDPVKRIDQLREQIRAHDHAYYVLNKPNITDAVYDKLFAEYVTLHDYFGRGENDVMKRLKDLKAEVRAE